jgi:hypothetical protein
MSSAALTLRLVVAPDSDRGWPHDSPQTDLGAEPVGPAQPQEHQRTQRPQAGVGAGPVRPARTLNDELLSLLRGETNECVVCGEPATIEDTHVTCCTCGSALVERPVGAADQLAMV